MKLNNKMSSESKYMSRVGESFYLPHNGESRQKQNSTACKYPHPDC